MSQYESSMSVSCRELMVWDLLTRKKHEIRARYQMKGTKRELKDAEEFTRGTTMRVDMLQVCFSAVKGKLQDLHKQMAAKTTNTSDNKAKANLFAVIYLLSFFGFFDCFFQERGKWRNRIYKANWNLPSFFCCWDLEKHITSIQGRKLSLL